MEKYLIIIIIIIALYYIHKCYIQSEIEQILINNNIIDAFTNVALENRVRAQITKINNEAKAIEELIIKTEIDANRILVNAQTALASTLSTIGSPTTQAGTVSGELQVFQKYTTDAHKQALLLSQVITQLQSKVIQITISTVGTKKLAIVTKAPSIVINEAENIQTRMKQVISKMINTMQLIVTAIAIGAVAKGEYFAYEQMMIAVAEQVASRIAKVRKQSLKEIINAGQKAAITALRQASIKALTDFREGTKNENLTEISNASQNAQILFKRQIKDELYKYLIELVPTLQEDLGLMAAQVVLAKIRTLPKEKVETPQLKIRENLTFQIKLVEAIRVGLNNSKEIFNTNESQQISQIQNELITKEKALQNQFDKYLEQSTQESVQVPKYIEPAQVPTLQTEKVLIDISGNIPSAPTLPTPPAPTLPTPPAPTLPTLPTPPAPTPPAPTPPAPTPPAPTPPAPTPPAPTPPAPTPPAPQIILLPPENQIGQEREQYFTNATKLEPFWNITKLEPFWNNTQTRTESIRNALTICGSGISKNNNMSISSANMSIY